MHSAERLSTLICFLGAPVGAGVGAGDCHKLSLVQLGCVIVYHSQIRLGVSFVCIFYSLRLGGGWGSTFCKAFEVWSVY
jgi:hypothetical protein